MEKTTERAEKIYRFPLNLHVNRELWMSVRKDSRSGKGPTIKKLVEKLEKFTTGQK